MSSVGDLPDAFNVSGPLRAHLLREAAAICRREGAANPDHPSSLRLRGRLALQNGHHAAAIACFARCCQQEPMDPAHHADLGDAFCRDGKFVDAEEAYRRALALEPSALWLRWKLGRVFFGQRRFREAAETYREILNIEPTGHPRVYTALAATLEALGEYSEALEECRGALDLRPEDTNAWFRLGQVYLKRGDYDGALDAFGRLLTLDPHRPSAHVGKGRALSSLGRRHEATHAFRAALTTDPHNLAACRLLVITCEFLNNQHELPGAWLSLAAALEQAGRLGDAETAYRQALQRKRDCLKARVGLGAVSQELLKYREGSAHFEEILTVEPRHVPAHLGLGWCSALSGDYQKAWNEFAWCDRHGERRRRYFEQPMWDGSPLEGRTILLWADQLLGDAIQFLRYVPLVKARGARIVLECQRGLWALVEHLDYVDAVVVLESPLPPFDTHAPLSHLPRIFETRADTIPHVVPYLRVDQRKADEWSQRLKRSRHKLVGLVWGGCFSRPNSRVRFSRLDAFAPLAGTSGVRFISLQQSLPAVELLSPPRGLEVEVFPDESRSIAETAAMVVNLDLVISVDTMMVHLAGALARPVWTLLASSPDWRWGAEQETSPWYPTMRLFRQTRAGDWHGLLERVRSALDLHCQAEDGATVSIPCQQRCVSRATDARTMSWSSPTPGC